ncbi:MAG: hypothetical protein RIR88_246 [Actinomycetota bacterium]
MFVDVNGEATQCLGETFLFWPRERREEDGFGIDQTSDGSINAGEASGRHFNKNSATVVRVF